MIKLEKFLSRGFSLLFLVWQLGCSKAAILDMSNITSLSVCLTSWGQVVPEGSKIVGYKAEMARCGSNCESLEFTCTKGLLVSSSGESMDQGKKVFPRCDKESKCSCNAPGNAGLLSHGVQVSFFKQSQVECEESCEPHRFSATCNDGAFVSTLTQQKLSGNYFYGCNAKSCKSCTLPWDPTKEAAHNEIITAFVDDTLSCGEVCESSTNKAQIQCKNGVWNQVTSLAVDIKNLKAQCAVNSRCKCTSADGTVFTHSPATAFKLFAVSKGTCSKLCGAGIDHTCKDGDFLDPQNRVVDPTKVYAACQETCLFCDLPEKDTVTGLPIKIAAGSSKYLYTTASVDCGQSCRGATLSCSTQGKLSINTSAGKIEDYQFSSCAAQPCLNCNVPWGPDQLANGYKGDRYTKAQAGCEESCESLKVNFRCDNQNLQILSGPSGITVPALSTSVASCSQQVCQTCTIGASTLTSGQTIVAYKKNTVGCGETCGDAGMFISRTCNNGALSGDNAYQYNSCTTTCVKPNPQVNTQRTGDASMDGGGAAPSMCPNLAGTGFVFSPAKVNYYTRKRVPCNDSCENYRKVVTCNGNSGLMGDEANNTNQGLLEPAYLSCIEVCN